MADTALNIIIPVYRGVAQTRQCLDSVVRSLAEPGAPLASLIVVNDASPEPALGRLLRERAKQGEFRLIEHTQNLGFPAAINSGLAWAGQGHVVLLNSDTQVPLGWLERLLAAAESGPSVATVTPFSNNAGICSVPLAAYACDGQALDVAWLDGAASRANSGQYVEIPVGVGFCMLITRHCLERIGGLDAATFGRGYGEETDLCRKAVNAGMINLLACDTFVYHQGRVSFGREGEARQIAAEGVIQQRYPDYPSALERWLHDDPAAALRVELSLEAIRSSGKSVVLQVTHRLGGGVERHVNELAQVLRERIWCLVLRPAAHGKGVCLALNAGRWSDRLEFLLPDEGEALLGLLQGLGVQRWHLHHTSGFPRVLWQYLRQLSIPMDVTLHDYSIIQGCPTLTDRHGRYIGVVAPAAAYEMTDAEQAVILQSLVRQAARCVVPSEDMRQRLRGALPWLVCERHAHPDREAFAAYPSPRAPMLGDGEPLRILCLGALGREKGAETLRDVARLARRRQAPLAFSLLGSAHVPLGRSVKVLGGYDDGELASLLKQARPHLLWFPVHWPETWSYTLSAALEAGLPVLASDIGAFSERLQGRPLSWLQPHESSVEQWLGQLLSVREQLCRSGSAPQAWRQDAVPAFYLAHYAVGLAVIRHGLGGTSLPSVRQGRTLPLFRPRGEGGWRGSVLRLALYIRSQPVLACLLARIPYNVQRRIKRALSRSPLH